MSDTQPRKVLSVASEVAPLIKTGGLADVAGALPGAMAEEGFAFRTILPGYRALQPVMAKAKPVFEIEALYGMPARVLATTLEGLELLILDAPHLFDRAGGPYVDENGRDHPDNAVRFAAFCQVAARIAAGALKDWRPDLVHLHDWQAGLTPVYLQELAGETAPPTLMTIHNIAFQGICGADMIETLGLPADGFTREGYEFWGNISALKAGLSHADAISTVSPTYARELLEPEFGYGLDGFLRHRSEDLHGILNGIDESAWDPTSDPHIKPIKSEKGKQQNKRLLEAEFGFRPSHGPLFVVISRLSEQKGFDLLLAALPKLVQRGARLALLGTGDAALESAWKAAAENHQAVSVHIGYDEAMSHRMLAGGDGIIIPSRFEPCGLTQLYGLRYGAVPLVARTGGLADTVIDANDAAVKAGCTTGIVVAPGSAASLEEGIERFCTLFDHENTFSAMRKRAMQHPVGWQHSAPLYAALFERMIEAR